MSDRSFAAGQLAECISAEMATPVDFEVTQFVAHLIQGAAPLGVLFYGSGLRSGIQPDTLLDFYVILKRQSDWPRPLAARIGNAVLPPNVEYYEVENGGQTIRAKVAFLTLAQFHKLTGFATWDTTVWARFSQPVRLVWAQDTKAESALQRCVMRAVVTAARWAAAFGPDDGMPNTYWNALYAKTYQTELRVEKAGRGAGIVATYPERFTQLLAPCWAVAGIPFTATGQGLAPKVLPEQRAQLESAWRVRRRLGRPLNILRLMKAAFTFSGGARYAVWKIERHSGIQVQLTPFAEKHPLLAGLPLLWKLWRKGAFSKAGSKST